MKVLLNSPVRHDGKAHAEGEVIDLPKADAAALIECCAAEAVAASSRKKDEAAAE